MTFEASLAEHYPHAIALGEFAAWTAIALEPFGFANGNALAVVGVCRDELMFATEEALAEQWGPAFNMSSLGAMVLLGVTGMAAAAQHTPGVDGRQRFVIIELPHIGIDNDGRVGSLVRPGQGEPSTACGAMLAVLGQIDVGPLATDIDPGDPEMSLLRAALAPQLANHPTLSPSLSSETEADARLVALTEMVRDMATQVAIALSDSFAKSGDTDIAVISGVVIHGPGGDFVDVREAWVSIGTDPSRHLLGIGQHSASEQR